MLRYVLACALALASPSVFAARPTDAQIDKLLETTHARSMVENMMSQVEGMQKQLVDQSLEGRTLTAAEQAKIDRLISITSRTLRDTMTWERMLPMYHRIYAESLEAEDIDAMIAFYETPAGQHVLERMPAIVQKSLVEVQQLLAPALKKMQQDIADELATMETEAKAAKAE